MLFLCHQDLKATLLTLTPLASNNSTKTTSLTPQQYSQAYHMSDYSDLSEAFSVSDSPYSRPSSRAESQWHSGPWYRLKLTMWYINNEVLIQDNTTMIKEPFLSVEEANNAAKDLAISCRGDCENVMLADRRTLDDNILNEYAVGKWYSKKVDISMGSWEFGLHRPNPFFKRNTIGTVSAIVQVVCEDPEHGCRAGSPLKGRSHEDRKHLTRIPESEPDNPNLMYSQPLEVRGRTRERRDSVYVVSPQKKHKKVLSIAHASATPTFEHELGDE